MSLAPVLLIAAALVAQPAQPTRGCQIIQPTAAQRQMEFSNAVALGPFAMRTLAGESRCDFPQARQGRCALRDPRLIHITIQAKHVWYTVPAGRTVQIDVAGDEAACRVTGGDVAGG